MKVAVFGSTLYAGVISALLAESGHQLFWNKGNQRLDSDELFDPSLKRLLTKQFDSAHLQYCDFSDQSIEVDVYILSFAPNEYQHALQVLIQLQQQVGTQPKLIINSSTFGLYGTQRLSQYLPQHHWIYLPDTVQQGSSLHSFKQMSQFIVGCDQDEIKPQFEELLRPLISNRQHYLYMPILAAEFTKLSISGMLATRISYINDLSVVAEKLGIDIQDVRDGMAADPRIGASYLSPGAGFGGDNFSHDILTLSNVVSTTGVKSRLLEQVWEINEQQKELLFRKLWNYFSGQLKGKIVTIWGAAFKENTANIQQSPVHNMLKALWAQGVTVHLHDPQALDEIVAQYGERDDLVLYQDRYEALKGSHALCLLTAWKEYWSPDYAYMRAHMQYALILDGRNIYDPQYVQQQGFAYMGVGRG